jgi:hypothetical protein
MSAASACSVIFVCFVTFLSARRARCVTFPSARAQLEEVRINEPDERSQHLSTHTGTLRLVTACVSRVEQITFTRSAEYILLYYVHRDEGGRRGIKFKIRVINPRPKRK